MFPVKAPRLQEAIHLVVLTSFAWIASYTTSTSPVHQQNALTATDLSRKLPSEDRAWHGVELYKHSSSQV